MNLTYEDMTRIRVTADNRLEKIQELVTLKLIPLSSPEQAEERLVAFEIMHDRISRWSNQMIEWELNDLLTIHHVLT
jgi:hypothetical protein